jgi:hypothetical protein
VAGALVLFTGMYGSAHWVASLPVPERSRLQSASQAQCLLVNRMDNIQWANGWRCKGQAEFANKRFSTGRRGNNEGKPAKTATERDSDKERNEGLRFVIIDSTWCCGN